MHLIGHVVSVSEMRYHPRDGSRTVVLIVKVSVERIGIHGGARSYANNFRVVCKNDIAEYAERELEPGLAIRVEGPIRTVKYVKEDCGCEQYSQEVMARFVARLPEDVAKERMR